MTNQKAEPEGDYHENSLYFPDSTLVSANAGELYLLYYSKAVRMALKHGCSMEDAEDLAQTAMRKGIVEGRCRKFDRFLGWLKVTIKRDYLNLVRRRKRFTMQSLDETYNEWESESHTTIAETELSLSIDPYITLFATINQQEWCERAGLTEREIQIVRLRFNEDMPVRNIAEVSGFTAKKVSKILDKAKAKLRQAGRP